MKDFQGKLAVVTGAGAGMGRELVRLLATDQCDVALCDVSQVAMDETVRLCTGEPQVHLSTHVCDVSNEAAVLAFRDDVLATHGEKRINLLFNNAGIAGGGSFLNDAREEWERTFGVCWYGVYFCTRAFMPSLVDADEAHIVNTSSINGFWASLGPEAAHTAYSAAKFAVKGFTEALITDLRLNAPHVLASVVMPGHIGTDIVVNTGKVLGKPDPMSLDAQAVARARTVLVKRGFPVGNLPDDAIRQALKKRVEDFKTNAPMSARDAAQTILSGVRDEQWRILVGEDAHALDRLVRGAPERAYEEDFIAQLAADGHLQGIATRSKTAPD